jgi:hypothetical protein
MNLTVNQSQPFTAVAKSDVLKNQAVKTHQPALSASTLKTDIVEIKSGVLPTLLGVGGGALAGGLLSGASTYAAAFMMGTENAELAIIFGGALGAVAGAATGGVVANMTNDKRKAALYGALVGGGLGLGLGLAGGGIPSAVTWGALGVGAGLGGAYAGAAVAKTQ